MKNKVKTKKKTQLPSDSYYERNKRNINISTNIITHKNNLDLSFNYIFYKYSLGILIIRLNKNNTTAMAYTDTKNAILPIKTTFCTNIYNFLSNIKIEIIHTNSFDNKIFDLCKKRNFIKIVFFKEDIFNYLDNLKNIKSEEKTTNSKKNKITSFEEIKNIEPNLTYREYLQIYHHHNC